MGVQNGFKTLFHGCGNLHFVDCQFKMEIFFGSVSVAAQCSHVCFQRLFFFRVEMVLLFLVDIQLSAKMASI